MWLVQWGQRVQFRKLGQRGGIQLDRGCEDGPTMHDAMARGNEAGLTEMLFDPLQDGGEQRLVAERLTMPPAPLSAVSLPTRILRCGAAPIFSTSPAAMRCKSASATNNANLMLDEPAFTVRMASSMAGDHDWSAPLEALHP